MAIYQLWDVEAGVSQGVFVAANQHEAFTLAELDAKEEGRIGPAEESTEVRLLGAFPFDEHDSNEVDPLILRRWPYGQG